LKTNVLSVVALLTRIRQSNVQTKHGHHRPVISSVAGDRGRSSNYVYGSAKALVTTFLSGLRQRSGVSVITCPEARGRRQRGRSARD
jgi:decaprenylphospho-beta-D-erythro-pentofuranosid-2-ulose 2-reductase